MQHHRSTVRLRRIIDTTKMSSVGDVPDLTADPSLAEKELGFKAKRNLEEMCR